MVLCYVNIGLDVDVCFYDPAVFYYISCGPSERLSNEELMRTKMGRLKVDALDFSGTQMSRIHYTYVAQKLLPVFCQFCSNISVM